MQSDQEGMTVRGIWLGAMAALLILTTTGNAAAQQGDPTERAAELASQAADCYAAGDVLGAINLFHEAMSYVPDPAFAFNLAQLYDSLDVLPLAYRFYLRYLQLYPGAPNRTTVEARISELTQVFSTDYAHLLVTTEPSGAQVTATIGDRVLEYGPSPVDNYVLPGAVTITARQEGHQPASTQRNAVAGVRLEVSLQLPLPSQADSEDSILGETAEPPPLPDRGESIVLPVIGWTMVAVGLGLTGVGTYFWVDAHDKETEYNDYVGRLRRNENIELSEAELRQLGDDAEDAATIGNLLGIPGVIVIAGGVTVLLVEYLTDDETDPEPVAGPMVLPGGFGFGLSGAF